MRLVSTTSTSVACRLTLWSVVAAGCALAIDVDEFRFGAGLAEEENHWTTEGAGGGQVAAPKLPGGGRGRRFSWWASALAGSAKGCLSIVGQPSPRNYAGTAPNVSVGIHCEGCRSLPANRRRPMPKPRRLHSCMFSIRRSDECASSSSIAALKRIAYTSPLERRGDDRVTKGQGVFYGDH
jgi:hypothetical protein